jgi:hypothetical protein
VRYDAHTYLRAAAMPPRRAARAAAAADVVAATTALLLALPDAVMLAIFTLLPVDCRLRCAEVCRGWRRVLLERSMWARLDLSAASGVHVHRFRRVSVHEALRRLGHPPAGTLDALLRCAAARAGGGLQSLRVEEERISHAALLKVAAANAGALRELCVYNDTFDRYQRAGSTPAQAQALLAAAPQLRTFATDLFCDATEVPAARSALRNEAPFGPLRVRHLCADIRNVDASGIVALAADVAAHASMRGLSLACGAELHWAAATEAVVDEALTRQLQRVSLGSCALPGDRAPDLARLLSSGALTTLQCGLAVRHLDPPAASMLAAALRANATLTSLKLTCHGTRRKAAAAMVLLRALKGHASLRVLDLEASRFFRVDHRAAVGAVLGALVAANAPALTQLDITRCELGDDGLRPLFEALPHNSHLRALNCCGTQMSDACGRDVLLPALRANTSLRSMRAFRHHMGMSVARELRSREEQP